MTRPIRSEPDMAMAPYSRPQPNTVNPSKAKVEAMAMRKIKSNMMAPITTKHADHRSEARKGSRWKVRSYFYETFIRGFRFLYCMETVSIAAGGKHQKFIVRKRRQPRREAPALYLRVRCFSRNNLTRTFSSVNGNSGYPWNDLVSGQSR